MMFDDEDGFSAEFMLEHGRPLDEVLAFVIARDDVRRIPRYPANENEMGAITMRCEAA